jgi:uncharacterized membrane protein YgcG
MLIIVIIILAVILLALLVRPVRKPAAGGKGRDRSAAGDAGIAPPSSMSDFTPSGGDFGGAGSSGSWDTSGDGGGDGGSGGGSGGD